MKFKHLLFEKINSPSEKQILSGNYKKRKIPWNGLTVSIENDAGTTRSGTDRDGHEWSQKIHYDYGYINRTMAKDGDQIDIFMGPDLNSELVFVMNQIEQKSGKFDEYKIMAGWDKKEDAIKAYLKNYEKGWKVGEVIAMSLDRFKEWIKDGNHNKPAKLSEGMKMTDTDADSKDEWIEMIKKRYKRAKFERVNKSDLIARLNGKQVGYWDADEPIGMILK